MDEQSRSDLQRAGEWLSQEVTIRVSRKVLVAAGLAVLVLIGVALD